MASFSNTPFSNFWKRILQVDQSSNTGVDTIVRNVLDGDGNSTAMSVSDDSFRVKPVNDNTIGTFKVSNSSGSSILAVDTTNDLVKVGASQVRATTQYAYFGNTYADTTSAGMSADTHYAIPFNGQNYGASASGYDLGSSTSSSFNDTNPSTSLTISTTANKILRCFWYVPDNITILGCYWWHGADAATGDSTAAHLMSYDVDSGNGSTGGDLSNGTVLADGATVTNAGYEQIYYQSMTIQSADVNAGKVIVFTFCADTVNSDYTNSVTVKYNIR